MALVDYTSDSSEPEPGPGPGDDDSGIQPKRRKIASSSSLQRDTHLTIDGDKSPGITATAAAAAATTRAHGRREEGGQLPPLPSAFHDLYASTVRVSTSDDPALHQGRKRVNPHKVGNWPSHLYIEWHPTIQERNILTNLLTTLQASLTNDTTFSFSSSSSTTPNSSEITSLLTSDLGAPQPLHISLSRPISLTTSQKDDFQSDLEARIRGSGIPLFDLAPLGMEWHRTHESARSFLVLRVGSASHHHHFSPAPAPAPAPTASDSHDYDASKHISRGDPHVRPSREEGTSVIAAPVQPAKNPQLAALLARCNALASAYGQPALYSSSSKSSTPSASTTAKAGTLPPPPPSSSHTVEDAFHVSVAWSFAPPTAELRRLTEDILDRGVSPSHPSASLSSLSSSVARDPSKQNLRASIQAMRIRVDGIKSKIGNVVTHVPLPDGSWKNGGGRGSLFGV